MLRLADRGVQDTIEGIKLVAEELRTAMFGIAAPNIQALQQTPHLEKVIHG
jgi:isopentenyl diphosphate isomerase/L-lactate dehydrogenase-like FMN-dependent dehydrogenase